MKGLIEIKDVASKRYKNKQIRRQLIVEAARKVFSKKGIEKATMTEIAKGAGVGVASVYRYFETKTNIAIVVGVEYWKSIIDRYEKQIISNINSKNYCGIEKVRGLLNTFISLYRNEKDFLVFIEEFDNYLIKNEISATEIKEYEEGIQQLTLKVSKILQEGKEDGTIREDVDESLFYHTITHALMSLCQKLTLRGNILNMDKDVEGEAQIQALIDMAIVYLHKGK